MAHMSLPILCKLKIILELNQNTAQCEEINIPVKTEKYRSETHFAISETKNLLQTTIQIKKIFGVKEIVKRLDYLSKTEQNYR